jgi:hypothetical protein
MGPGYRNRVNIFARFTTGRYSTAIWEAGQFKGGKYSQAYCSLIFLL